MTTHSERTTALLLAGAQALFQTASVVMVAVGGLVGLTLATDARMATLPVGMVMVAATVGMIPAALFMQRYGRRSGFLLGCLLGTLAGLTAMMGVLWHSFGIFLAANALLGLYGAFAGYYRFAAADAARSGFRSQALSWVVAGGVIAAFLGPAIVRYSNRFADMGLQPFMVAFMAMTALGVMAILLVSQLRMASMIAITAQQTSEARPLAQVAMQPVFITALCATTIGNAVMVMVMTATPLAMKMCGFGLTESTTVIQWHILGMFLPSFVTGKLIQRAGVLPIMTCGVLLLLGEVAIALSGIGFGHFTLALALLGLGWNFLFIGGSTLLTDSYRPAERSRTQAAHDFTVFSITSIASLSAGGLLATLGWQAVNLAVLPALLLVAVAIGNLAWRRKAVAQTFERSA